MSNCKMLIDATHPEETRVVVQRNGRVEEFDFESAARKLLRGNIYLAKVTRVEPSLQAAFVDYGGNRHGFLAFNEIHPDYYQIPVADRQALIDEEAAAEAELEAAADRRAEALERRARQRSGIGPERDSSPGAGAQIEGDDFDDGEGDNGPSNIVDVEEDEHIEVIGGEGSDDEGPVTFAAASVRDESITETLDQFRAREDAPGAAEAGRGAAGDDAIASRGGGVTADNDDEAAAVAPQAGAHDGDDDSDDEDDGHDGAREDEDEDDDESDEDGSDDPGLDLENPAARDHALDDREPAGDEGEGADEAQPHTGRGGRGGRRGRRGSNGDLIEDVAARPRRRPRSYKIQEVIKRRQVILVQVVKEERGNKGAALTTYLSLAGRYTVLMPNTARGGGISRKITNPQDRKRLKAIAQELDVPEGMGLIIRTAGAARTKQEIKRDFEYLLRLWESVRDLTLQSTAPSLVYEEGDLIKRSIRDLYNKDVEEVVVAGDAGYREAADFMHMLLPSHSKHVVPYNEPTPLFARYGVERQLNAMFSPQVTLRSGGYIVINQTEALVAIDVNSGKSTREFSIEETALATNLEAADEIARQLKLRDLAGLIVIDFIDMEEKRNNRAVERRLKDALRHDRARIQLGRISHFGLMEMSRQRLRTGVLEGSTSQCQHCQGTGIIRSTESIALAVLRGLEDAITAGTPTPLIATTTSTVALYILNSKRAYVADMEARHGYAVSIMGSDRVHGANFTIERGAAAPLAQRRPERAAVNMDWGFEGEGENQEPRVYETDDQEADVDEAAPRERAPSRETGEDDASRRGGRRRRRRRGRRGERNDEAPRPGFLPSQHDNDDEDGDEIAAGSSDDIPVLDGEDADTAAPAGHGDTAAETAEEGSERRRRRRRGRRGGRRGRGDSSEPQTSAAGEGSADDDTSADGDADAGEEIDIQDDVRGEAGESLAPGFEPQPDIIEHTIATGDDEARANRRPPRQRSERRRPERIWDRPADDAAERLAGSDVEKPAVTEAPASAPSNETAADREPAAAVPSADNGHAAAASNEASAAQEPSAPRARRHETGSSEPRLERVVVRPGADGEGDGDAPATPPSTPQRKGWWQRRFGGE